jgi:hypothetical protein
MYVVPGSTLGVAVRLGAGASFLASDRVGFGVDLVLEGGVINGQWIGGLQLLASPELRF